MNNDVRKPQNHNLVGVDIPTKIFLLGRTKTKGYKLFGSVLSSQSKGTTVEPPAGLGRISRLG